LNTADPLALLNIIATVAAVVAAPIIALWVNSRLQRRADSRAAKVRLFNTLIGLRHNLFKPETVEALNSIDAVFVDEPSVREAWSQLIAFMNDPNVNNPAGWAVRDAKRRDLLLAMVRALGWTQKITTADLMRVYAPQFTIEEIQLQMIERALRKRDLVKRARDVGIDPALFGIQPDAPTQPSVPSAPSQPSSSV
jgi:hypothetical protein